MNLLRRAARDLYPGYFALVMATGIVSIAAFLMGMGVVARVLLWINVAAYGILWLLTGLRATWYGSRLVADVSNHARGAGFFTVVAGTCVLGSQLVVLGGPTAAAVGLWLLGAFLWFVVTYGFFTVITVRPGKPLLTAGINGAWLIAIVATQSVAILGTRISHFGGQWEGTLVFAMLCLYLAGCMLYILLITLIFYRFTFFNLEPEDLSPPYWINMGAVAITTLAGATLLAASDRWPVLAEMAPFLKGFTLFFWATATWWIPLLLLLGAWRHLYRRYPLRYEPHYWGMVFPLGMYTVCTHEFGRVAGLAPLLPVARWFVYLALAAWTAAFAGLLHALVSALLKPDGVASDDGSEAGRPAVSAYLVHCPVHGVEAEVHLALRPGAAPEAIESCSLHPDRRGVPCEGHCVTTGVEKASRPTP